MRENDFRNGGYLAIGVAIGFFLFLMFSIIVDWFDFMNIANSAFLGSIAGALVAGLIGVAGQSMVLVQNANQISAERELQHQIKLEAILSKIAIYRDDLSQIWATMTSTNLDSRAYIFEEKSVPNVVPIELPTKISLDEIAVTFRLFDTHCYNKLVVLNNNIANIGLFHPAYRESLHDAKKKAEERGRTEFRMAPLGEAGPMTRAEFENIYEIAKTFQNIVEVGLVTCQEIIQIVTYHLEHRFKTSIIMVDPLREDQWDSLFRKVSID